MRATGRIAVADQLLEIIREFDPAITLKYNKFYIGLAKNGRPNNFVVSVPRNVGFRWRRGWRARTRCTSSLKNVSLMRWTTTPEAVATGYASLLRKSGSTGRS